MALKILNALIAIVGGIGGAMLLFWILNKLSESLKGKWEDRVKPWAFAGPAILAIAVYLIYPALVTIQYSFANADSTGYVGFKNYTDLLTESEFLQVLLNNLLWIIIVPAAVVVLGLGVAVLADRLRPRGEKLSKTIIFLPMAISMVGAATIWRAEPRSGRLQPWLRDARLAGPGGRFPGANGLKVAAGFVYVANTAGNALYRIAVDAAGTPRGVEVGGVDHPGTDGPQQPDVVLPGFLDTLEPQVDDDVGAHLAVQRDHGGHVVEVEDVHRLAADLAEDDVARGDVADGGHHAPFPPAQDLGRLGLVVESVRPRPRLAATSETPPTVDVDVQQCRRTHETECGQREPERDHRGQPIWYGPGCENDCRSQARYGVPRKVSPASCRISARSAAHRNPAAMVRSSDSVNRRRYSSAPPG